MCSLLVMAALGSNELAIMFYSCDLLFIYLLVFIFVHPNL